MYFLFNVILYSILGFLFETGVCAVLGKEFESGFTYGPYTLVYGISLAIMFALFRLVFKRVNKKFIRYSICFVLSFILISVFEFAAGKMLETFFDVTYWNYSDMPLTFYKYVNLFVSLFWAIASILIFKFVLPFTDRIYKYIKPWMIITMTSLILVDIFFSVISML